MAIDEAMLEARIEDAVPNTLRIYGWQPSAASIGRFQDPSKVTHIENCLEDGISVVRRISGGGAVFHDAQGETTYAVVARKQDLGTFDLTEIYVKIYSGLAKALENLGVTSDFNKGSLNACPNLTVKGRKISGSAQAHREGVVLQHGTLLVDVNLKRMFRVLKASSDQTCTQIAESAESKITSLRRELGRKVSSDEASEVLVQGFQTALEAEFVVGKLTQRETRNAENLRRSKYATEKWNQKGLIHDVNC